MPAVLPDPVDQVRDDIAKHRYPDMTEKFEQMRRREELHRLEREVVTRAKEFTDDKEPRDGWDALVAYRELCRAVDALSNFESKQEK